MLVKGLEEAPQKRKRTTPTTCRRDSGSAVTNARFIARLARWPAPPPPGPRSLRCIPLALVTDGLDDMRFRRGSAARRFTTVTAALCAPLRPSVPLPLADAQTEARRR